MNSVVKWIVFLAVGIVIGFSAMYFIQGDDTAKEDPQQTEAVADEGEEKAEESATETNDESGTEEATEQTEPAEEGTETVASTDGLDPIFEEKGCLQCHAFKGEGGPSGPDLTVIYKDVEDRFGKTLEEFLDEPEGTMEAVFSTNPLTDEEKDEVITLLKQYYEEAQ